MNMGTVRLALQFSATGRIEVVATGMRAASSPQDTYSVSLVALDDDDGFSCGSREAAGRFALRAGALLLQDAARRTLDALDAPQAGK